MCSENQEPKNRRWLATSLEVEVFDVDPKKPALTFWVSCNPRPRMETSSVPNRDGVCSPKARGLMVLPGIRATREWNKVSGEYLTAHRAKLLSSSDFKRQELSPLAEFSRHCLWVIN
jgi:hypothetical protein